MSTTTIRRPVELKARVADAARRSGTRRAQSEQVAEERYDGIVASDRTIPWGEMRHYTQARAGGKRARKPIARKLSR
jgi:hypothetical protein